MIYVITCDIIDEHFIIGPASHSSYRTQHTEWDEAMREFTDCRLMKWWVQNLVSHVYGMLILIILETFNCFIVWLYIIPIVSSTVFQWNWTMRVFTDCREMIWWVRNLFCHEYDMLIVIHTADPLLLYYRVICNTYLLYWKRSSRVSQLNCQLICLLLCLHDNGMKWKHFPYYWLLVKEIHGSQVCSSCDVMLKKLLNIQFIWQ